MNIKIHGYVNLMPVGESGDVNTRLYRHTMIATDLDPEFTAGVGMDALERKVTDCFGGITIVCFTHPQSASVIFTTENVINNGEFSPVDFCESIKERLTSCLSQ